MKAIVYNQRLSCVRKESDVVAIKLAYLLANTTVVTAELASYLLHKKLFKSLTLIQKITAVEEISSVYLDLNDPESVETNDDMMNLCRKMRICDSQKHTSREAFLQFKRIEKSVLEVWIDTKVFDMNNLDALGYFDLFGLVDNKSLKTDLLELSIIGGAWIKKTNEQIADKLMKLFCGKNLEDEPAIVVLQEGFFEHRLAEDEHFTPHKVKIMEPDLESYTYGAVDDSNDEVDEHNPGFLFALRLPFIEQINSSELKAIKGQLRQAINGLNEAINRFSTVVTNSMSANEIETVLFSDCQQAAVTLHASITNNQFLTNLAKTANRASMTDVMLGYMLTKDFFKLLGKYELITPEVATIIQERLNHAYTANLYTKFIPLFNLTNKPEDKTNDVLPSLRSSSGIAKKKSISLD